MQKPIALLTILMLILPTYAQDTAVQKKFVDVSVSLAGLGGDYVTNSMGIQAGVEFRLKNNVSMQCDIRYVFDVPMLKNKGYFIINVDELSGFLLNMEIKTYVTTLNDNLQGGYVGGKVSNLFTASTRDHYQVKRNKTGLYGIIGWKHVATSGFLFEVNTGLGMQLICSNSNKKSNEDYYLPVEFPWSKPYVEGSGYYPDFTCNLRIGWRF